MNFFLSILAFQLMSKCRSCSGNFVVEILWLQFLRRIWRILPSYSGDDTLDFTFLLLPSQQFSLIVVSRGCMAVVTVGPGNM